MKDGECEALWPNLRVGWDPPGPPSRPTMRDGTYW